MKTIIQDAQTLSALRPLEVLAYLRGNGWTKASEKPGQWSIWVQRDSNGGEIEAAVPLNHDFRDFARRMAEVLLSLEAFEGRSQLQIIRDLFVTNADVIRLRLADSDLADASVPLEEGATFFQKAKDLMLAAACAAVSPRGYYPSRKPAQAMDYIRQARLGQTETGSFIMTIISQVPPSLAGLSGQLIQTDEPFERRVTQRVFGNLNSLARVGPIRPQCRFGEGSRLTITD